MEWQDISTAPKDGTEIIVWGNVSEIGETMALVFYNPSNGPDLVTADGVRYASDEWCWAVEDGPCLHRGRFTHWTYPPKPPVQE